MIFSDRLKLLFIPLLRYFDSVMQNGYMQLQVRDIKIKYDLPFLHVFMLVTYPASVVDWSPLHVGFGSEMPFAVNQADNNPFPATQNEKKKNIQESKPQYFLIHISRLSSMQFSGNEFQLNSTLIVSLT